MRVIIIVIIIIELCNGIPFSSTSVLVVVHDICAYLTP